MYKSNSLIIKWKSDIYMKCLPYWKSLILNGCQIWHSELLYLKKKKKSWVEYLLDNYLLS